jgi:hypothetical protein
MPKNNVYRLFRLTNGDNLVAKIHRSSDDKYYLERPMKITSIIANDPTDPNGMFKRELVYLSPWVEYSNDNVIPIRKSVVISMCVADSEISTAYDMQKEREDTGGSCDMDNQNGKDSNNQSTPQDNYEDILNRFMFEDGEFITDNSMDITDMSIKDIVNNILEDIIINSKNNEKEWDEEDIDKSRDDYGCHLEDWSPYLEDYFKEKPHHKEQDDTEKDSEES